MRIIEDTWGDAERSFVIEDDGTVEVWVEGEKEDTHTSVRQAEKVWGVDLSEEEIPCVYRLTDAPESYDGFGTKTVEVTEFVNRNSEPIRKVKIEEANLYWQEMRYSSGLRLNILPEQISEFKGLILFEKGDQ
jgi:hypothetical protein